MTLLQKQRTWARTGARAAMVASLVIGSGVGLIGARPALAQGNHTEDEAQKYFLEGKVLFEQGEYHEAYDTYMKAWMLRPSFERACNLSQAALALPGKEREAAELLRYCEKNFVPNSKDKTQKKKRQDVENLLAEARGKVGVAKVRVTRDDGESAEYTDVFVDGMKVGYVIATGSILQQVLSSEDALLASPEVFVDPGTRKFSASSVRCPEAAETTVTISQGEATDVALILRCRQEILIPKAFVYREPSVEPAPPWYTDPLMYVGFGAAAVGIGLGIGAAAHSTAKSNDTESAWIALYDKDGGGACRNPANQARCSEMESAYRDTIIYRGVAIGGFVGGGAVALGTVLYLIGGRSPSRAESSAPAEVSVIPGIGGAVIRGTF